MKSYLLVGVQFLTLLTLALTSWDKNWQPTALLISLLGVAIAFWAVGVMGSGRFSILPTVRPNSSLVTTGPYAYVRHPMYLGMIIFGLGLLLIDLTPLRIAAFAILLIDLLAKIEYEEMFLHEAFPKKYEAYATRTARLIPGLY